MGIPRGLSDRPLDPFGLDSFSQNLFGYNFICLPGIVSLVFLQEHSMLQKSYTENLVIHSAAVDLTDTWRPSAILEAMQDAAVSHCVGLQLGRPELLPKGLAWVITRSEIVMDRLPRVNEHITITTAPMPARRFFFPRFYLFHDAEGKQIGKANSLWVLMDLETRHAVLPDAYIMEHYPDNSDLTAPMGNPGATDIVDAEPMEHLLTPQYTDIDANLHMNNVRYMDWACNALGIETLRTHAMTHFIVNYNSEIRPGEVVRTVLQQKEGSFAFSGFAADDSRHFSISGDLMPR